MQIDALLKDFVVKANMEDFIFLGITNKNVLYFRVMHAVSYTHLTLPTTPYV